MLSALIGSMLSYPAVQLTLGSERRETVRSSIRCERRKFEGFIIQYERTGNDVPLVFRLLRQQ